MTALSCDSNFLVSDTQSPSEQGSVQKHTWASRAVASVVVSVNDEDKQSSQ